MQTLTIPVLSTAHITEDANEWLSDPFYLWAIVASYEGGYFISAKHLYSGPRADELHAGLVDVLRWALENEHDWIRLDRDGDVVPELLQYEW